MNEDKKALNTDDNKKIIVESGKKPEIVEEGIVLFSTISLDDLRNLKKEKLIKMLLSERKIHLKLLQDLKKYGGIINELNNKINAFRKESGYEEIKNLKIEIAKRNRALENVRNGLKDLDIYTNTGMDVVRIILNKITFNNFISVGKRDFILSSLSNQKKLDKVSLADTIEKQVQEFTTESK